MSRFCKLFQNARYPIIQAPMAGGSTPEMALASCEAGIIGSFAKGTQDYDSIFSSITYMKTNMSENAAPYNINLMVQDFNALPDPTTGITKQNIDLTRNFLQSYIDDNNLTATYPDIYVADEGEGPYYGFPDPSEQIQAVLDGVPPIVSATFGIFTQEQVTAFQNKGILVVGTAASVEEASTLSSLGVDGIVLQGDYAGGHRGTWTRPLADGFMDLSELVTQCVNSNNINDDIPLIACGGIMNSTDIKEWLDVNGVTGVQVGTVFLNTSESYYIGDNWKNAMRDPDYNSFDNIDITQNFTGKWEMPIKNDLYRALEKFRLEQQVTNPTYEIPQWPFMNNITYPFHHTGDTNLMSIYCGRMTSKITEYELNISTSDLCAQLVSELDETKFNRDSRRRGSN